MPERDIPRKIAKSAEEAKAIGLTIGKRVLKAGKETIVQQVNERRFDPSSLAQNVKLAAQEGRDELLVQSIIKDFDHREIR